jgi:hypothetical protein
MAVGKLGRFSKKHNDAFNASISSDASNQLPSGSTQSPRRSLGRLVKIAVGSPGKYLRTTIQRRNKSDAEAHRSIEYQLGSLPVYGSQETPSSNKSTIHQLMDSDTSLLSTSGNSFGFSGSQETASSNNNTLHQLLESETSLLSTRAMLSPSPPSVTKAEPRPTFSSPRRASSFEDASITAREVKESIRQSRQSLQALREDTRRTINEAREIREGMQALRKETRREIGEARELREVMKESLVFEDQELPMDLKI